MNKVTMEGRTAHIYDGCYEVASVNILDKPDEGQGMTLEQELAWVQGEAERIARVYQKTDHADPFWAEHAGND
jgi:hypothetical protein